MFEYAIYQEMLALGEKMGEVIEAHMYSGGYISIVVRTRDGKITKLNRAVEEATDAD